MVANGYVRGEGRDELTDFRSQVIPAATITEAERLWSIAIIAAIGEQFDEDINLVCSTHLYVMTNPFTPQI